ncbi:hypothetical protein AX17_001600 [Amanita inopinata Kibby_2008]|nr:hypothetical protein AX17_001600 [Amanita inopinata Kibby_2008]
MAGDQDIQWKGYAIHDTKHWDEFQVIDFKPKEPGDYDIDIKIEYCGVCASDVHTITGGWGEPLMPIIPGHEIVGYVVRVGPKVTEFKVGDRAGVGPQVLSCFKCAPCTTGNEQYCKNGVDTYNSKYPNGDVAQGGYSTAIRAHERFVFPLPKELSMEEVAPMLCAGMTVYSPLVRNGAGPGKVVGVVGIGGLGHYALQFARALGAERVVAFSHSPDKKDDVMEMGATDYVLHTCVLSCWDMLTSRRLFFRASKKEVIDMLKLAVQKNVKSMIQLLPMCEAGTAVRNVKENKVRYRHVLKVDI